MKKAIFVKFIQIILVVLVLSSSIFYIASSSAILKKFKKRYEIHVEGYG